MGRSIVILDGPDELLIAPDVDLRVRLGVPVRNASELSVVQLSNDRVVPTVVRLSQHALDAGAQVLCAIEDRNDHAHERAGFSADRPLVSGAVKVLTSRPVSQPPRGVRAQ
jgi:hypothetical protein